MKKSVIFFSTAIALTVLSGSFLSCKQEVETEPEFKVMEGTLAKPEVKVESKFGENVITWSVVDHAREFYIYRAEKAVEAAPTEETPAAQILAKKNKKTEATETPEDVTEPVVEEPVYDWTFLGKSTETHGGVYYDTISTTNKLSEGKTYIYKVVASGNTARAAKEPKKEITFVSSEDVYYYDSYATAEVTVAEGNIPAYKSALPSPEASFTSWTNATGGICFAANQSTPNDRLTSTVAYAEYNGIPNLSFISGVKPATTWPTWIENKYYNVRDIYSEFRQEGLTIPGTYTIYTLNVPGKITLGTSMYGTTTDINGPLSDYYRESESVAAKETISIPCLEAIKTPSVTISQEKANTPKVTLKWSNKDLADGATLVIQKVDFVVGDKLLFTGFKTLDLSKAETKIDYNVANVLETTYTLEDADVELGKEYIYLVSVTKEGSYSVPSAYYIKLDTALLYNDIETELVVSADKKSATGVVNYTVEGVNLKSVKLVREINNFKTGVGSAKELSDVKDFIVEWNGKTYIYYEDKELPKLSLENYDMDYVYTITYVNEDSKEVVVRDSANFGEWNENYALPPVPASTCTFKVVSVEKEADKAVIYDISFTSVSNIDIEDLTVEYFFKKEVSESASETTYLTVETGEVTNFKMNGAINTYIISVPFKELELDTEYTFEAMAFYKGKPKSGLYSDTVKYLTPTE